MVRWCSSVVNRSCSLSLATLPHLPEPVTRLSLPVPGACVPGRCSPRLVSFPPPAPPLRPVSRLPCSQASSVLRHHPTPHRRSCRLYGFRLFRPDCSSYWQPTMRPPGSRACSLLSVPGVYDYAGSEDGLATFAPVPVLPSLYVHKVGTPDSLFEALYPSPLFPSAYASTTGSRPPPQD